MADERESQAALEGEVKGRRADVLEVLQVRLANPVPESIRLAVEGTNDPDVLKRWLRLAVTERTIREFAGALASTE